MKAYFFGNRRRLQCVYGAPRSPYQYIPDRVFRSKVAGEILFYTDKVTTPAWRFGPGNARFPGLSIQHEGRGVEVVADTHAGKASLTSGLMAAARALVQGFPFASKTLEIAEGRHRPAVMADFSLRQSPGQDVLEDPNSGIYGATYEPWGEHFQVVSLRNAGGVVCFLEKTSQGYGQRYIRLALRELWPLVARPVTSPIASLLPPAFPLEGASSYADCLVSLFTVSEVNGQSESILHSALIPLHQPDVPWMRSYQAGAVTARVSLALAEDGQDSLYVSLLSPMFRPGFAAFPSSIRPLLVHTAVIPYSRPSPDATIFGAIKSPAGLAGLRVENGSTGIYYLSSVGNACESTSAAGGLRVVGVSHDTLVDIAFMAGATARPDIDNQSAVSTRRDEIEVSELPERVVTGNVRCGADVEFAAPEQEGEATQLAPTVEFTSVRAPFLAEMYSGSRQVIKAKALATSAHVVDGSCLAHHSSVVHALPADQSLHLLGTKFSSAIVTVVARGKGRIVDAFTNVTNRDQYTVTVPQDQDISLDQLYEWTKFLYSPATIVNATTGNDFYAMPLGEFECHPFSIGGSQSTGGLTRASLEQINTQFSYQSPLIPQPNGGTFQVFTGWTMNVTSHAELVAVFGVALQEYGTYRTRDFFIKSDIDPGGFDGDGPVSDLEYANAIRPSPASPIGQLVDAAVFVPPLSPSPVLCMQLFARTVTTIALSDSYDNSFQRPLYGYSATSQSDTGAPGFSETDLRRPRMVELGRFMFNKAQTAALIDGDEVTATTWRTAHTNLPERNDPGGGVSDQLLDYGESYSSWPQSLRQAALLGSNYGESARFWLNFKVRLNIDG